MNIKMLIISILCLTMINGMYKFGKKENAQNPDLPIKMPYTTYITSLAQRAQSIEKIDTNWCGIGPNNRTATTIDIRQSNKTYQIEYTGTLQVARSDTNSSRILLVTNAEVLLCLLANQQLMRWTVQNQTFESAYIVRSGTKLVIITDCEQSIWCLYTFELLRLWGLRDSWKELLGICPDKRFSLFKSTRDGKTVLEIKTNCLHTVKIIVLPTHHDIPPRSEGCFFYDNKIAIKIVNTSTDVIQWHHFDLIDPAPLYINTPEAIPPILTR